MKPQIDCFELMKLAKEIDTRVVKNRSARYLLLLLSTYANEDGVAWPGMTTLGRCLGYTLTADGRLTKGARGSISRVFTELAERGLVRRTDCDCKKERHRGHFQLDIMALAVSTFAASASAKLRPSVSRTA